MAIVKNIKVRVQEPDFAADEMFGEPGLNFYDIGEIEFLISKEDWDFTSKAIFDALVEHGFLDNNDWDISELVFENVLDIDWVFVKSITSSEPMFKLKVIA